MTKLTKEEEQYIDTERLIFETSERYELHKKKSVVNYVSSYQPTKYLIKLLRKKYNFPNGKYNVIYVDFPWKYKNKKTGGSHTSGASQKYETIPTSILRYELSILINSIAADNAVIFMWCTAPMWKEQMTVFDAMDFTEKSMVFWHKTGRLGMGYWVRHQVEFMMMGIKGNVKAFRTARRNLLEAPIEKHSKKPEIFRQYVQDVTKSMGKVKRIELFARSHAKGWKSWGDQIG